jgi:hypothetical protein
MSTTSPIATIAQVANLMVLGLLAGAMFGIWRGYDPAAYSAATFLEVHQGAVRGLNFLLPAMGAAGILLAIGLGVRSRRHRRVVLGYAAVAVLAVAAGIVTRTVNQPINDLVMTWTPDAVPADWTGLRDRWWTWHIVRLALSIAAEVVLILTVFADRSRVH